MFNVPSIILSLGLIVANLNIAYGMTDPMRPPGMQVSKSSSGVIAEEPWKLTAILIGVNRRLATINGKTITIGGNVNGAKLVRINPAGVTLTYQRRQIDLKLLPLTVKRQRDKSMEQQSVGD